MKRWAWNLFCLVSLLVFAGSMMIWARSYFVAEGVNYERVRPDPARGPAAIQITQLGIAWSEGGLCVHRSLWHGANTLNAQPGWSYEDRHEHPRLVFPLSADDRFNFQLAGVQFYSHIWTPSWGTIALKQIVLPLWLFLPAAMPPFLWWRRWRKNRGRGFLVTMSESANPESNHQAAKTTKAAAKI